MGTRTSRLARRAGWSLIVAGFMLVAVAARSEAAEGNLPAPLPFSNLDLTLRSGKAEYVLGEPVCVYTRLVNQHQEPVKAHGCWGWFRRGGTAWQGGEVWLYIQLARGGKALDAIRPYGMEWGDSEPPRAALIPPGAVRRAKQFIAYGHERVGAFLAPGKVRMTVKLRGIGPPPGETLASNVLDIRIRAPEGREVEAFQWLAERKLLPYLGYLLFVRDEVKEPERLALKEFLKKYGDTAYAPYVRFSLGQAEYHRARYEQAIEQLRPLILRADAALAEDALYLTADSFRILLKPAESEHALALLLKRHPDTVAAEDAQELRNHLWGVPLHGRPITSLQPAAR